jgi:formin-binding protein 1
MLLNSLQDLSELRTQKLNLLWTQASAIEQKCVASSTEILQHTSTEVAQNFPIRDSAMFVQHNVAPWNEPVDFVFEPSPIWHDSPDIITDEFAKVFLRNMVSKSREGLTRIQGSVTLKQQEVAKLRATIKESQDREAVSDVFSFHLNLTS